MKHGKEVRICAHWGKIVSKLKCENFSKFELGWIECHWLSHASLKGLERFGGASPWKVPPFFDSRVCLLKAVDGAWVWVLVSLLWGRSTDWCNHYYLKETTWESQNDFSTLNRDVWFECKAANSCVSWFEPVNKTVVSPLGHKKTKQISARSFRIKTSRPVPYWRRQPSASKLTCAFYIQLYFRHRNWSKDFCWSLKRRKKRKYWFNQLIYLYFFFALFNI